MNEREIREAFRLIAEGTDPAGAADAVRRRIEEQGERRRRRSVVMTRRKWTAALASAAALILLTAAVAAAPVLRNYLNAGTLRKDSVRQLTEVPEGWIGVYSTDDLDAVRENLGGYYILMADLAFAPENFEEGGRFAGGWTPIGGEKEPFTGIFNGNGHTVDGLRIDVRAGEAEGSSMLYAGLFGYVASDQSIEMEVVGGDGPRAETAELDIDGDGVPETVEVMNDPSPTVIHFKDWGVNGTVKNLRLRGGSLRVVYPARAAATEREFGSLLYRHVRATGAPGASAGPIAGYADYVLGCSVEDFTVTAAPAGPVEIPEEMPGGGGQSGYLALSLGGVAGQAYLVDSCFSDAAISVPAPEGLPAGCGCYAGGIAGIATACVTSYFGGTVESGAGDCGLCFIRTDDVPRFVPAPVMDELILRLLFTEWENVVTDTTSRILYTRAEDFDRLIGRARKEGITAETFYAALDREMSEPGRWGFADSGWLACKLMAFYRSNDPGISDIDGDAVQAHYTADAEGMRFYILDPGLKYREYRELSALISAAFPDGDFMDFCRENNVKYGCYYAYDLRTDPDSAFEGFDFDAVWTRDEESGLPVLRIFR